MSISLTAISSTVYGVVLVVAAITVGSVEGFHGNGEVRQEFLERRKKKHHGHKKKGSTDSESKSSSESTKKSESEIESSESTESKKNLKSTKSTQNQNQNLSSTTAAVKESKKNMSVAEEKRTNKRQPGSGGPSAEVKSTEEKIMSSMKSLEDKLAPGSAAGVSNQVMMTGKLDVNGPLPVDFNPLFAQSVAKATSAAGLTNCAADAIKMKETNVLDTPGHPNVIVEIVFEGPMNCIIEAQKQAAAPDSPLIVDTPMYAFLVAKGDSDVDATSPSPQSGDDQVDIDAEMPFGTLEPFGREDTAQELTENSIKESDSMVDQIERAQVAEEKRAVFRALTRLRGAAIASFDGVATSQTGNIDGFSKSHRWRNSHPLHHLASQEADVSEWSFPSGAD